MILILKSIYQTVKVKTRLFVMSLLGHRENHFQLAIERCRRRGIVWSDNNHVKIFAIFNIKNWEEVLLSQLQKIGETYHFLWKVPSDQLFSSQDEWREHTELLNQRLITEFENFYNEKSNIWVFLYASDHTIFPESIEFIKRKNVIITSFCWDDLLYYKSSYRGQPIGVSRLSRLVDLNLTMSPESIVQYEATRSPCFFWKSEPLEIDEESVEVVDLCVDLCDDFYVLFIGTRYGRRGAFIDAIRKKGITVKCYGNGWENPPLPQEHMIAEIQKAPITLGFANVGYTWSVTTIKGRDFEVPLWGGLYLTQYSLGLESYYYPNKDVYVYRDLNECVRKIKYIRDNPREAKRVRLSGKVQALKYATWDSRFRFLLGLLIKITKEVSH